MKLERLFEAKNQKLYRISGEEVKVTPEMVKSLNWSDVESDPKNAPEAYNEEFLAHLRDELKSLEAKSEFVFIEPRLDVDCGAEQFTAAMKHTARRIKDCVSVIGFSIPEEIAETADFYREELSAKHAHYCFFCKKPLKDDVVLY